MKLHPTSKASSDFRLCREFDCWRGLDFDEKYKCAIEVLPSARIMIELDIVRLSVTPDVAQEISSCLREALAIDGDEEVINLTEKIDRLDCSRFAGRLEYAAFSIRLLARLRLKTRPKTSVKVHLQAPRQSWSAQLKVGVMSWYFLLCVTHSLKMMRSG